MKNSRVALLLCVVLLSGVFLCVGYATLTDQLTINGSASAKPPQPDVYITSVAPTTSAGVTVVGTTGTLLSAKVTGGGTATFTVIVTNVSDTTYVFERVIDGAETGVEGVYSGSEITHRVNGIASLSEILPHDELSFTLTVDVPAGITAEHYVLLFRFLPKGSSEILPDGTKYEVTFKPGNGDADQTILVDKNAMLSRPIDPVRDGYTFTGWYKDPTALSAWDFSNEPVTANIILYGGWHLNEEIPEPPTDPDPSVIQYEVVFKYNNGDVDQTVLVDEGSPVPRPADPTRDGYLFMGWYKDASCTTAWNFDTDTVAFSITLYASWKDENDSRDPNLKGDFAGLVDALLSPDTNNGLNSSTVIYNALGDALDSNKRPAEDAPILHCSVNSIPGGTMSDLAASVNAKLDNTLQFFFEADPTNADRIFLYMYYEDALQAANIGEEISVYKQILLRGSDGEWKENGTYLGRATVGYFFGGGNNGKDVLTVDAYSWKASTASDEEAN